MLIISLKKCIFVEMRYQQETERLVMMQIKELVLIFATALSLGCAARGRSTGQYPEIVFRNLHIVYPNSMVVAAYQEYEDISFVSFFLQEKEDAANRIEFGISEFGTDFLSTVPRQELFGELAANASEMRDRYFSLPSVTAQDQSEIQISMDNGCPEAYIMATATDEGMDMYCIFSSKIVGNYSVTTMSRSKDPLLMEAYMTIIDSITINQ